MSLKIGAYFLLPSVTIAAVACPFTYVAAKLPAIQVAIQAHKAHSHADPFAYRHATTVSGMALEQSATASGFAFPSRSI